MIVFLSILMIADKIETINDNHIMLRLSFGWCLLILYLILITFVTAIFLFYCGKLIINLSFIRNKIYPLKLATNKKAKEQYLTKKKISQESVIKLKS